MVNAHPKDCPPLAGNPYFFAGRRLEQVPSRTALYLYNYRFRYYLADIGRFLQPDPIGTAGGINLYAYCGNNPVNFIDPFGLDKQKRYIEKRKGNRFVPSAGFNFAPFGGPVGYWEPYTEYIDHGMATVIDNATWNQYLYDTYLNCFNHYWIGAAALFDTYMPLGGSEFGIVLDDNHNWFYIEQFGIFAQGFEINYIGQGMLYRHIYWDDFRGKIVREQLPRIWKSVKMVQNMLGNSERDYKWYTENEDMFTDYGYMYYDYIDSQEWIDTVSPTLPNPAGVNWECP